MAPRGNNESANAHLRPPIDLASLRAMIAARKLVLGGRAEAVLRAMLENEAEAALASCQAVAKRCNVSPATVYRLAASLGFENYAEFRALFRQSPRPVAARPGPVEVNALAFKDN